MDVLAKFHSVIHTSWRIIIPKATREFYEIKQGDVVELLLIKYQNKKPQIKKQFLGKVGEHGSVIIPKPVREVMKLKPKEIAEVIILDHHKQTMRQERNK